jgi:DNA-3-methyladenine glycosylase II
MSSRRSARLSEASPNLKQASSAANEMPPPQVANISKNRKNPAKDDVPDAAPLTPKRKKATKPVPPMTPTPSAIGLMTAPYSSGDIDDSTPPPLNRLAVPNGTNAPLVTPETHRLLANKAVDQVSPSKKGNIKSTTGTLLEEALAHLVKVEPRLKPVIEKHHCHVFSPEGLAEEIDPFRSLVSGIISQQVRPVNSISWTLYSLKVQVSGAAAKSIKAKFVALFNTDEADAAQHSFPTPSQVCASSIEVLRTAGLSQRKAEYVHGLAQKFHSGEITTEMLFNASYEEVLEELIKVRGLGKWSVEMFACFGLKRMDVFSTGDLGVQRGMAALMGRDVGKLKSKGGKWKYMSEKEMEEISEKFQPYR